MGRKKKRSDAAAGRKASISGADVGSSAAGATCSSGDVPTENPATSQPACSPSPSPAPLSRPEVRPAVHEVSGVSACSSSALPAAPTAVAVAPRLATEIAPGLEGVITGEYSDFIDDGTLAVSLPSSVPDTLLASSPRRGVLARENSVGVYCGSLPESIPDGLLVGIHASPLQGLEDTMSLSQISQDGAGAGVGAGGASHGSGTIQTEGAARPTTRRGSNRPSAHALLSTSPRGGASRHQRVALSRLSAASSLAYSLDSAHLFAAGPGTPHHPQDPLELSNSGSGHAGSGRGGALYALCTSFPESLPETLAGAAGEVEGRNDADLGAPAPVPETNDDDNDDENGLQEDADTDVAAAPIDLMSPSKETWLTCASPDRTAALAPLAIAMTSGDDDDGTTQTSCKSRITLRTGASLDGPPEGSWLGTLWAPSPRANVGAGDGTPRGCPSDTTSTGQAGGWLPRAVPRVESVATGSAQTPALRAKDQPTAAHRQLSEGGACASGGGRSTAMLPNAAAAAANASLSDVSVPLARPDRCEPRCVNADGDVEGDTTTAADPTEPRERGHLPLSPLLEGSGGSFCGLLSPGSAARRTSYPLAGGGGGAVGRRKARLARRGQYASRQELAAGESSEGEEEAPRRDGLTPLLLPSSTVKPAPGGRLSATRHSRNSTGTSAGAAPPASRGITDTSTRASDDLVDGRSDTSAPPPRPTGFASWFADLLPFGGGRARQRRQRPPEPEGYQHTCIPRHRRRSPRGYRHRGATPPSSTGLPRTVGVRGSPTDLTISDAGAAAAPAVDPLLEPHYAADGLGSVCGVDGTPHRDGLDPDDSRGVHQSGRRGRGRNMYYDADGVQGVLSMGDIEGWLEATAPAAALADEPGAIDGGGVGITEYPIVRAAEVGVPARFTRSLPSRPRGRSDPGGPSEVAQLAAKYPVALKARGVYESDSDGDARAHSLSPPPPAARRLELSLPPHSWDPVTPPDGRGGRTSAAAHDTHHPDVGGAHRVHHIAKSKSTRGRAATPNPSSSRTLFRTPSPAGSGAKGAAGRRAPPQQSTSFASTAEASSAAPFDVPSSCDAGGSIHDPSMYKLALTDDDALVLSSSAMTDAATPASWVPLEPRAGPPGRQLPPMTPLPAQHPPPPTTGRAESTAGVDEHEMCKDTARQRRMLGSGSSSRPAEHSSMYYFDTAGPGAPEDNECDSDDADDAASPPDPAGGGAGGWGWRRWVGTRSSRAWQRRQQQRVLEPQCPHPHRRVSKYDVYPTDDTRRACDGADAETSNAAALRGIRSDDGDGDDDALQGDDEEEIQRRGAPLSASRRRAGGGGARGARDWTPLRVRQQYQAKAGLHAHAQRHLPPMLPPPGLDSTDEEGAPAQAAMQLPTGEGTTTPGAAPAADDELISPETRPLAPAAPLLPLPGPNGGLLIAPRALLPSNRGVAAAALDADGMRRATSEASGLAYLEGTTTSPITPRLPQVQPHFSQQNDAGGRGTALGVPTGGLTLSSVTPTPGETSLPVASHDRDASSWGDVDGDIDATTDAPERGVVLESSDLSLSFGGSASESRPRHRKVMSDQATTTKGPRSQDAADMLDLSEMYSETTDTQQGGGGRGRGEDAAAPSMLTIRSGLRCRVNTRLPPRYQGGGTAEAAAARRRAAMSGESSDGQTSEGVFRRRLRFPKQRTAAWWTNTLPPAKRSPAGGLQPAQRTHPQQPTRAPATHMSAAGGKGRGAATFGARHRSLSTGVLDQAASGVVPRRSLWGVEYSDAAKLLLLRSNNSHFLPSSYPRPAPLKPIERPTFSYDALSPTTPLHYATWVLRSQRFYDGVTTSLKITMSVACVYASFAHIGFISKWNPYLKMVHYSGRAFFPLLDAWFGVHAADIALRMSGHIGFYRALGRFSGAYRKLFVDKPHLPHKAGTYYMAMFYLHWLLDFLYYPTEHLGLVEWEAYLFGKKSKLFFVQINAVFWYWRQVCMMLLLCHDIRAGLIQLPTTALALYCFGTLVDLFVAYAFLPPAKHKTHRRLSMKLLAWFCNRNYSIGVGAHGALGVLDGASQVALRYTLS